jgi:hypothetical protein
MTHADGGMTDDLASSDAELVAAIADVRTGYERTQRGNEQMDSGRAEWRDGTWQMVTGLTRLRELDQRDDRAFGAALTLSGLDKISKDDRAALLDMARYPDIAKAVLATTERTSWRNIWRKEIKPQVDRIAKEKEEDDAKKDADANDRGGTDDDHSHGAKDDDEQGDGDDDVDTNDDRRPPRGSRNRISPNLAPLLEAVNGVGKGLREWGKRKSNWAFYAPDEMPHAVTVKAFDLWIAKACDDDDKLTLLRERVEAARVSRQQSEVTPDGSVPNPAHEAMAAE